MFLYSTKHSRKKKETDEKLTELAKQINDEATEGEGDELEMDDAAKQPKKADGKKARRVA